MKLRTQMLLAGAFTLAIPIIGWQSVKQLDASLKQARVDAQTLQVANARVALAEAADLQVLLDAVPATTASDRFLYAETARYGLFLDGYADDWQTLNAVARTYRSNLLSDDLSATSLQLRLAKRDGRLFVYLDVADDHVMYHRPPRLRSDAGEGEIPDLQTRIVNGDAVEVYIRHPSGESQHVVFRAIAPGPVSGVVASLERNLQGQGQRLPNTRGRGGRIHSAGTSIVDYRGVWRANNHGYQLELDLPLPPLGSIFGIAAVDVDTVGAQRNQWVGTLAPKKMRKFRRSGVAVTEAHRLLHVSDVATRRLQAWATRGVRARLFDRRGYLLADVNSLYDKTDEQQTLDPARGSFLNAVIFRLFAYFISDKDNSRQSGYVLIDSMHLSSLSLTGVAESQTDSTARYITQDNDRVLGTLLPIGGDAPNGFLLVESNEDLTTAYAGSRLARLFSLLTLASLIAGGVLLLFASVLSLRIRRLSRQADLAVADDGRVLGLSGSGARDEIGDLSRNLSALLSRSAQYTRYLEALSSRLSHELRTPLTVVKTSIENMDRDRLDRQSRVLLDRASGGADQLGSIIKALIESTRLEQTVQRAQMMQVDMRDWLAGSVARYRQIYPELSIQVAQSVADLSSRNLVQSIPRVTVHIAPELVQQAFDKLVDNAVGYSSDGVITLILNDSRDKSGALLLAVANRGEPVAAERLAQMFDPMYSERGHDDGNLHLGLGLYIVRMIAEAHGGQAVAECLNGHTVVGMRLPG